MFETRSIAPDVTVRIVQPGDAAVLAEAYRRNREHLAPWEPLRDEEFFSERFQREDIERRLIATAAGEGYPLALVDGTEIIGRFNLAAISRGPFQSAGLGYWVDRNHLGRGPASAAVGAIVAEARDTLRLHRIEASTLVHNTASPQPPPGHPARLAPEVAAAHHRGRRNHRGRTVTGASILPA